MAYTEHAPTAHDGAEPSTPVPAPRASDRAGRRAGARRPAGARTRIAVYGCEPDETALFRELAPRLGVEPTITSAPLSGATVAMATGHRCISVDHRTRIPGALLHVLRAQGVTDIRTRSTGCDHIDVDAARGLGMTVEGVAYSPASVADYTLMLMLMAVRDAGSIVTRAAAGDFRLAEARGRELRDLTVGVVGTGRIGAAVIDRLRGFGCRVLAYDRRPKTSARYVALDELVVRCDLVTLHTPLSAGTRHLLSRERIGRMRRGAIVVNTGRGALVDTDALASALESGRLGGAALDVVEGEDGLFYADRGAGPIGDEALARLRRLPNVLITPHTAYRTEHALQDTVRNTLLACLEVDGARHA